ncbi:hypothetical protein WT83_11835 [Burkholderia territorii]|uniref:Secreted protein n=1 Tax=Burkholderia territorii TaxID=1503055 RepID=A0A108EVE8_9BURK|nr:hypothetical protein WT83_11835 [Burkholderia territorii]
MYVSSSVALVSASARVAFRLAPAAVHAPVASTVPRDPSFVVHTSAIAVPIVAPPRAIAIMVLRVARDAPFECDFAVSDTAVHVLVAAFQMLR